MLCTANQCRSPMAEVLLKDRLGAAGIAATVRSAGDLPGGAHASPGSVRAMARRGLDLRDHVSRALRPELIDGADLIVAMARRHLRSAVAMRPPAWPRTFTLKELVRRGRAHGRRRPDETLEQWLGRLHEGRILQAMLGDDSRDDVADPIGGPEHLYEATAVELSQLIDDVVDLAFGLAHDRETA